MTQPSGSPPPPTYGGKRAMWEQRYREKEPGDFHWFRADAPPELEELLERGELPEGGALDVGCGPGSVTVRLAQVFRPAIGMDIAHTATVEAARLARDGDSSARFLVGEAPALPFRDGSFGLIFDRGCLQAVSRSKWPAYFGEIDRLLTSGGILQLYCSQTPRGAAHLLSAKGFKRIARRVMGRKQASPLSRAITQMLPASMETVEMRDERFRTPQGRLRLSTYGLFRKR
jgi:ubiquinone/menaquinone biosynthesis C-methylase UbiE